MKRSSTALVSNDNQAGRRHTSKSCRHNQMYIESDLIHQAKNFNLQGSSRFNNNFIDNKQYAQSWIDDSVRHMTQSTEVNSITQHLTKLKTIADREWTTQHMTSQINHQSTSNFFNCYDRRINDDNICNLAFRQLRAYDKLTQNSKVAYTSSTKQRTKYLNKYKSLFNGEDKFKNMNEGQNILYSHLKEHNLLGKTDPFGLTNLPGNKKDSKYFSNTESKNIWMESMRKKKSTIGHVSQDYDIMTQARSYKQQRPAYESKIFNKQNGISDFTQNTRLFAPNFNKDYQQAYEQNKSIFKRKNGSLTKLADFMPTQSFLSRPS